MIEKNAGSINLSTAKHCHEIIKNEKEFHTKTIGKLSIDSQTKIELGLWVKNYKCSGKIIEDNFPKPTMVAKEVIIVDFQEEMSVENVIEKMTGANKKPANLYETLAALENGSFRSDSLLVILGSSFSPYDDFKMYPAIKWTPEGKVLTLIMNLATEKDKKIFVSVAI